MITIFKHRVRAGAEYLMSNLEQVAQGAREPMILASEFVHVGFLLRCGVHGLRPALRFFSTPLHGHFTTGPVGLIEQTGRFSFSPKKSFQFGVDLRAWTCDFVSVSFNLRENQH